MFRRRPKQTCLFIGLDGAGKTTTLHAMKIRSGNMKGESMVTILPTCGIELHSVTVSGVKWTVWDMGGQGRYRDLWQRYYARADAVVLVVDGNDVKRLGTLRDEFHRVVHHPDFQEKSPPLLVLVNKASEDGKCLLSEDNVSRTLRLETLPVNQRVKVVNCNGVTGAGVDEGFSWLDLPAKRFVYFLAFSCGFACRSPVNVSLYISDHVFRANVCFVRFSKSSTHP